MRDVQPLEGTYDKGATDIGKKAVSFRRRRYLS